MPKAVIVGAGINGLCAARALVLRGWRVEILDRGPIPNPEAASFARRRLIRGHYPDPALAARFPAARAAWAALWRDLGRAHFRATGVLALSRAAGDWTDRARAAASAAGAPVETLDPGALAARCPGPFALDGVRFGLHDPAGGVLAAAAILRDLAGWLARRGAILRPHAPVDRIDPAAGSGAGPAGRAKGDVAILAAGVGLPRLAPDMAGDLVPRRVVVVHADPPPSWAAGWASAPAWVDLGGEDDLWGAPAAGGLPIKLGAGRLTRPGDPASERDATPADAAAVLDAYRGRMAAGWAPQAPRAAVNFYLAAPDERFVLRRDRRAILLSADSGHGFKFGPLTGEDLADALEPGGFEPAAARLAGLTSAGASPPPAPPPR